MQQQQQQLQGAEVVCSDTNLSGTSAANNCMPRSTQTLDTRLHLLQPQPESLPPVSPPPPIKLTTFRRTALLTGLLVPNGWVVNCWMLVIEFAVVVVYHLVVDFTWSWHAGRDRFNWAIL